MKRRLTPLVIACFVTIGCAMQPLLTDVPTERQVLVIFGDAQGGRPLVAGSKRSYRADALWPVSLHVRTDARRVARDHDLNELHAWPIPALQLFCVVFQLPDTAPRSNVIRRLRADPRVEHVQPVNVFRGMLTDAYDDPLFDVQYGEHAQALESVHALTTGRGVRIGIVDGPVDAAHEDLRGQIARQVPRDDHIALAARRHGTAVAGVIAAAAGNGHGVVGLAPDAIVSVYAACRHAEDQVTRCTSVSLAEAIEQAMADQADVINLSLAGPEDWLLERLLRHAHEQGAVVIAAYDDQFPNHRFPALLPFVHSAPPGAPAWFARPEQFSTRAGGGYQLFFGSSMSAAGVAGMAALLRSEWSPQETEHILSRLLGADCLDARGDARLSVVAAHEDCAL